MLKLPRELKDFESRGVDQDIIDLRFKHFQHRLIDTLNRVTEKRRLIKEDEKRAAYKRMKKLEEQVDQMGS